MRKQRYTLGQVEKALNATGGKIYLTAAKLGCTSATVCNYVNRYPSLRKVIDDRRGRSIDIAERKLDEAVKAGEGWAVRFILNCLAKDRGYIEREAARDGASETNVNVTVNAWGRLEDIATSILDAMQRAREGSGSQEVIEGIAIQGEHSGESLDKAGANGASGGILENGR